MKFLTNWKTTLSGIASLAAGLAAGAAGDFATAVPAVTTGLGLIFASDGV